MSFTFRPALREQTSLLIGVAGPSNSGKTASALKIARGIMGGHGQDERIFVIDTEAKRALHYACGPNEQPGPFRFRFQHGELRAPFSPDAYRESIAAAVAAGAGVVVVDSMSHEHESEGGILEWHERELDRMAGQDYGKRERMTFAAWIKPKSAHNKLVGFILQQPVHFIFCFRAKDKMKLVKTREDDPSGREGGKMVTKPVQLGWTPICSDRFEYEMTTLLMMPPGAKGVPDLDLDATKINAHHREFFPKGHAIDEQAGMHLAEWARGGAPASSNGHDPRKEALDSVGQAIASWFPGQSEAEKTAKGKVVRAIFGKPWAEVQKGQPIEDLEACMLGGDDSRLNKACADQKAAIGS